MIFGDCPYADCAEVFGIPFAGRPTYEKWNCEKCQRVIWTRHSRLDPWSMTEAAFHAAYIVDEASKAVTKRDRSADGLAVVDGPRRPQ